MTSTVPCPICCSNFLRRNPGPHAAAGGGGSAEAGHRRAGRAAAHLRGRPGFATPRRLALDIVGPARARRRARGERRARASARRRRRSRLPEERRPRRRSTRRRSQSDPKKGEFYVAVIEKPGRRDRGRARRDRAGGHPRLPWPKSMRWGAALREARGACAGCVRCTRSSAPSGRRPRSRRSCAFEVDGIASGNVTYGHRFMAPGADQRAPLRRLRAGAGSGKVVLDADRRKEIILPTRRTSPSPRAGAGRGRGPARGGRRPGRMAGRADGRVRGEPSSTSPPR